MAKKIDNVFGKAGSVANVFKGFFKKWFNINLINLYRNHYVIWLIYLPSLLLDIFLFLKLRALLYGLLLISNLEFIFIFKSNFGI